ncbi:hypothetical protein [Endozoicomonas arenosclerae]|uniref:hypothetical protein n=1 Tax=Endozoicomonas arenosclerae TaxID=1633495 RepID=UPI000786054F|nr:hypothetical protein [Endozoicomonas arenosclerae]
MSEKLEALKKQADELGVSYNGNIGEDTLQKRIDEALGNFDNSDNGDTPGASDSKPSEEQEETVTINLQRDEKNPHDLPVGVNGKVFLIQRGVDVKVPRSVYEVLKDCTEDHYDEEGKKTARQSYPFTVVV